MNEISTIQRKELNELLPKNLISEMDIDTEGTHTYEDTEDEIVDDLAYHPKPNSTETVKENPKERFYSDSKHSYAISVSASKAACAAKLLLLSVPIQSDDLHEQFVYVQ